MYTAPFNLVYLSKTRELRWNYCAGIVLVINAKLTDMSADRVDTLQPITQNVSAQFKALDNNNN